MMIFQLAIVLAQLRLQMNEQLVERAVRVRSFALRLEHRAGIKMQSAVRVIKRTIVRKDDVRLPATVEMLGDGVFQTDSNARRERLANLNLLT